MEVEFEKNKYNLTMSKIRSLKVTDLSRVCEPIFKRYGNSWQIQEDIGDREDFILESYDSYDIRIFDGSNELTFELSVYAGMSKYEFEKFTGSTKNGHYELENAFLKKINELIDMGIIGSDDIVVQEGDL